MKALYDMFIKSWVNLGFDGFTFYSKHYIGGGGCNYKFDKFFSDLWSVIKFIHDSMYLQLICNQYPSWGLDIGEV
jgi:hypothetical protein